MRSISYLLLLAACGQNPRAGEEAYLSRDELLDPKACRGCHAQHYDEWASSLHAYASDDPLFQAMNRRGQREARIGKFCVNCHAPMAVRTGATEDGLNLADLPQELKGVTCYFCHSVDGIEGTHDNALRLANDDVMRGQYRNPVRNDAHRSAYSSLIGRDRLESSQLCGSCHDIVNGHGTHIERTFKEWQETVFSKPGVGTTCSQCHMDQGAAPEAIADLPGLPARRRHSHLFPGVDLPLTPFPGIDRMSSAIQALLDKTLQSALCVRGAGDATEIQVVLDNVSAGHSWPSGSAQDRRAWVEVTAYAGDEIVYRSGAVPTGTPVTELDDPDLWLMRDCLFDEAGNEVHMFWEAVDYESNLLPGPVTSNPADPRFYQTHVVQRYPRGTGFLPSSVDRVTMNVHLQPFAHEVFDDLVASGDLADTDLFSVPELRNRLGTWSVGSELEWTPATATENFLDRAIPISCISTTNLKASASKVPAVNHVRCKP